MRVGGWRVGGGWGMGLGGVGGLGVGGLGGWGLGGWGLGLGVGGLGGWRVGGLEGWGVGATLEAKLWHSSSFLVCAVSIGWGSLLGGWAEAGRNRCEETESTSMIEIGFLLVHVSFTGSSLPRSHLPIASRQATVGRVSYL